jgi:hypothetical protein
MKKTAIFAMVILTLYGPCFARTQGQWSLTMNNLMVGNMLVTTIGNTTSNPGLLSCIPSIGYNLTDNSAIDAGYIGWNFLGYSSSTNYLRYTYYFGQGNIKPHLALDAAFSTIQMNSYTRDYTNIGLIVGTEYEIYKNLAFVLDFRLFTSDMRVTTRGNNTSDYNAGIVNLVPFLSLKWTI